MNVQQSQQIAVVEIGWIVAGELDDVDLRAVKNAHRQTLDYLREKLPEFDWQFPLVRREELVTDLQVEPASLLDDALAERNLQRWDATIIITAADLISRYQSEAYGVLSRSLEAIVVSTRRIDPRREKFTADDTIRENAMSKRVQTLILHALGRMFGLSYAANRSDWMYPADTLDELDHPRNWSENEIYRLRRTIREIADQRLEELPSWPRKWAALFYISSAWHNRSQILHAVRKAQPWKFPFRLSRLTAASISGVFLLLITAEVWELGLAQDGLFVALFSSIVIALTTWYVVVRQRLLVRRYHQLTEQNVMTNLSTVAIVMAGIITTYLILLLLTFAVGYSLFDSDLLKNWTNLRKDTVGTQDYFTVAGFVATLGILVGALGATFEGNQYFHHVTFVDEEF